MFSVSVKSLKQKSFKLLLKVPKIREIADKELNKVDQTIADQFGKIFGDARFRTCLPARGLTSEEIMAEMSRNDSISKIDWKRGRASGEKTKRVLQI